MTEQTSTETTARLVPSAMVAEADTARTHLAEAKSHERSARAYALATVRAARRGDLAEAGERAGKSYKAATAAATAADAAERAAHESVCAAQRSAVNYPASADTADQITVAMIKLTGEAHAAAERAGAQHRAARAAKGAAEAAEAAKETASGTAGDLTLTVRRVRTDPDGRTVYLSTITETTTGAELHADTDMSTGAYLDKGPEHALAMLTGFLSAAAESWNYAGPEGDNAGIFPAHITERAAAVSEELGVLHYELTERTGPA